MPSLFFWNEWPPYWRRIWFVASTLFVLAFGFMWFSWFQGNAGIIHWEKIQEQKVVETTVHSFRLGPFELHIPGESYVILEYLQGSDIEHNTVASYIFLFLILASAMVLLAVITTLERFWFFSGMSVFILFMVSLRLDVLRLFGQSGILVPAIVLLIFLAVSFYFKSIRPETPFTTRLLTFSIMAVVLASLVKFFGEIAFPLLYLSMAAYTAGLVLSILFIVMVAHEILVSFVYVAGQGGGKSLRHFLLISVIYLVNVFITLLYEIDTIQWDFIYINLYLLFSFSAILGLWGFKLREDLYNTIFEFAPYGALFFVALATICFGTLGQLLGNANDATLRVIRDMIIFSHFAFGIAFLTYIFSNFMAMMAGNMPVYKVLYRPNRMPYFTFRLAGVIITLAFIFASYWQDYVYRSMAGFYNYAADLYQMQGNETFARALYDRARVNAFQNHRANYSLAMIKAARLDFEGAFENFDLANGRNPSDFSLVNQGNLYLWRREYFPAIQVFQEAQQKRSSPALSNNLGFAYATIHNLDSALHYIAEARQHKLTRASAETNFFGMTALELLPVKTDSILKSFDSNSPGVISNALAMATLFDQDLDLETDPLASRELDLYSATLLNNYIIRNARSLDTTFTNRAIRIAEDSVNITFREAVKASLAFAYYHQGNVYKAQQILGELFVITQSYQGKYNYIQGLWALEQGNPDVAVTYFGYAALANYKQAMLYNAIALTEAQRIPEALVAWDSVASSEDADGQRLAAQITGILTTDRKNVTALADREKYQYVRYVLTPGDSVFFSQVLNSFENPNYKAQVLLDMCDKQMKTNNTKSAIRYYNQIANLEFNDAALFERAKHFQLLLMALSNDAAGLEQQLDKVTFDDSQTLEKMLYTAIISKSKRDTVTAEKNFRILGLWNPYFEEGILAAADYFRQKDESSPVAYDILAEAIQSNRNSVRLLKAYAEEAIRQGLTEHAEDALRQLEELKGS